MDYISSVLCINQDKKELNCEGKCFLNKQIKTNQEKQEKNIQSNFKESTYIPTEIYSLIEYPTNILIRPDLPPIREMIVQPHLKNIFHPPRKV